jgi:hypothetical protein
MAYKTCTHIHDNGYFCQSAAVAGREYCCYHLRHRGRLMRMAQARARSQRFDLQMPPLENMHAVQSALSQLVEGVAAGMIDLKQAHFLLSALRQAADNFKHPDAWQPSAYRNDQSQAHPGNYDNFEAEYGLPENLNLNTPPEVAFPPPPEPAFSHLSSRAEADVSAVGVEGPPLSRPPLIPVIPPPVLRDYMAEAEIAMNEYTPQDMELNEILKTQGYKAFDRRAREHQRDSDRKKQRKLFRANYERYVAEAKTKNIQRAAEKLVAEKLAAEKAAAAQPPSAEPSPNKKPPTSVTTPAPDAGKNETQKTA